MTALFSISELIVFNWKFLFFHSNENKRLTSIFVPFSVEHDNSGFSAGWFLDKVFLVNKIVGHFYRGCNCFMPLWDENMEGKVLL